jgi:hypothetical protein
MKSNAILLILSVLVFAGGCGKNNGGSNTGNNPGTGNDGPPPAGYKIGWQSVLGGSDNDFSNTLIATKDGGYLLAGGTYSVNSGDVRTNLGNGDIWVIKLAASGDTVWTKTFGGHGTDVATSAIATSDGGYIVAGYTNSIDGFTAVSHGGYDGWVMKLSSKGDVIWETTLGGTFDDKAFCLTASPDGGCVFGGVTYSNDGNVSGLHAAPNTTADIWAAKVDGSGNVVWSKALGGAYEEAAYAITTAADGGYALTGYTTSIDGDMTNAGHAGASDVMVMKLTGSGSVTWAKAFGGDKYESAGAICTTRDGGFVVAGYTGSSSIGDVGKNNGMYDGWLLKVKANGDTAWTRVLGGAANDGLTSVITTTYGGGGYMLAGITSSSQTGDVPKIHGGSDLWVVQLDSARGIISDKVYGGSQGEMVNNNGATIIHGSDGGYVVAGVSNSNDGDLQGLVRPGRLYDNVWILKMQ